MPISQKISLKQAILTAALIGVIITIPLLNNLNSIAIVFFVFASVIQQPLKLSLQKLNRSRLWIYPLLYFIWLCLSYFWDVTGGFAVKDIERYAILFFIPPVMAMLPQFSQRQLKMACTFFVAITIIICVICLFKSYQQYQVTHDYRVFNYHYLSMQMDLNAIFLSNYCLASITWLLYYGFVKKENNLKFTQLLIIIVAGSFLFGMIFLLSSKLVTFLTLVVLIFFILYIGHLKGRLLRSFLIVAIIIIAGGYASKKLDYLNWRINSTTLKKIQRRTG